MSAIIANYELVLKDAADPSTSTAAANLNADRYSEIIPLERAFVGDIQLNFVAGAAGTLYFQVSQDFGVGDDSGVERINSENIIIVSRTNKGKELLDKMEQEKIVQFEEVAKLREKRMQEENEARKELDKIHRKRISEAEKDRSDRLEEARRLIEKKLKEEEEIRLKEEKERKLKDLEERKIKGEEARKVQIEEVKRSKEIERENLKEIEEKVEERIPNNPSEEEKKDHN